LKRQKISFYEKILLTSPKNSAIRHLGLAQKIKIFLSKGGEIYDEERVD
jgi:hypothetical protein